MKKRLKFLCWNCSREYSLYREVEGLPTLKVACPYCNADAIANLALYRQERVEIFRSDAPEETAIDVTFELPAVIPTVPVTD